MISERLGHSSVGVTLEVYAHLAENAQDAAAAAMDRLLWQQPAGQSQAATR